MVAQSATLGATTSSPFSSTSGADYVSPYIPRTHYTSPLSGAFLATGTPGYSTGTGVRGTEVVRSDGLYYRPIVFYSVSMPFTDASSTVRLMVTTAIAGGNRQPVAVGDAATVTWSSSTAPTAGGQLPMQYAVSQCTTTDAAVTFYAGFYKSDANQTTWRRGVTSGTPAWAPDEIYVNGTKSTTWTGTSNRVTINWFHTPSHPKSLSAASGTNPGEVDLSWTAPEDNGGRTIYGYRIAYKKSGDTTWYVYGTNTNGSPSKTNAAATSETVRGLTPGESYSFVVSALNMVCDRYQGFKGWPDLNYADFTSTEAHTGQNSNIATGTATAMPSITAKFGTYNGSSFVPAIPKANNGTGFANATPYIYNGSTFTRPVQVTTAGSNVVTSTYTSGKITYTVQKFNASGEFILKEAQNGLAVDYLIVGGGGQGGCRYNAGGGGGGGVLTGSTTLTSNTNYQVIVGAGGDAAVSGAFGSVEGVKGSNGGDSSFAGFTAKGGGGGGSWVDTSGGDAQGLPGGSGGGNSGYTNGTEGAVASSGTSGQGSAGGLGALYGAGGGGGAGAAGSNGTTTQGGSGGNGVTSSITGTSTYYGGGGGGGSFSSTVAPSGGLGGGGAGAPGPNTTAGGVPTAGTNGLGGGGGGANGYGTTGATTAGAVGGSGVVIIRYISSIAP